MIHALVETLPSVADRADFLDRCVDAVVEVLGGDRGLVLMPRAEGPPLVINARSRGRALSPLEREEISRSILARVDATGRAVVWDREVDAASSESITSFGIVAAIAAPLRPPAWQGASQPVGILYVDFRDLTRNVGEAERAFVDAAAALMALAVEQATHVQRAQEDARRSQARGTPESVSTLDELLGFPTLRALHDEALTAVRSLAPVLVLGESGTGKTVLAASLAAAGKRTPIVRAMLGSSDDLNTISSELFGHLRGAFSGAFATRVGLVELADGGTLVLDELLNLPPQAQRLLLDFAQFGTYRPLGWSRREAKHARVRLIACTNGDVDAALRDGRLREDLYFRLAGVTLRLPPLRTRRSDIPLLARQFLFDLDRDAPMDLTPELRATLVSDQLEWPGNIRQLESVIARARERTLERSPGARTIGRDAVHAADLRVAALPDSGTAREGPASSAVPAPPLAEAWSALGTERTRIDELERKLIATALQRNDGVVAHAARELNAGRTSLLSRMQTLGIDRSTPTGGPAK